MGIDSEQAADRRQKSNGEIAAELNRKGHLAFCWDDLDKLTLSNGIQTSLYRVGLPDEPSSPTVFKVYYPPDCLIEAHTHECDYTEILLEGTQKVGATWHRAGDIRIGLANRGYGPLLAGPEGCTVLFFFADGRWPAITIGNNDGSTLASDEIEHHVQQRHVG